MDTSPKCVTWTTLFKTQSVYIFHVFIVEMQQQKKKEQNQNIQKSHVLMTLHTFILKHFLPDHQILQINYKIVMFFCIGKI